MALEMMVETANEQDEITARLTQIQERLDQIGPSFGFNKEREDLTEEKNSLLDKLIVLLAEEGEDGG